MNKGAILMGIVAIALSLTACSNDDNPNAEDIHDGVMSVIFTAVHETGGTPARSVLMPDNSIVWENEDGISVFDGKDNCLFIIQGETGKEEGSFSGNVSADATSFTALYPYDENAKLQRYGTLTDVTLPHVQTATPYGFDRNAALMIARTRNNTLEFKNAVGYVKVTPLFDCEKIELTSADDTPLSGTGTLNYNGGKPNLSITSCQSPSVVLIPAEGDIIEGGVSYCIAVPAATLQAGWKIMFTDYSGNVRTRRGEKEITLARNCITNLGEFEADADYWYNPRGIVSESQEVDMDITVNINNETYRVIFANTNLTKNGLALTPSEFGDYFAWGATEPWYTSYRVVVKDFVVGGWKEGKADGYTYDNAPQYDFQKSFVDNRGTLAMESDPARQILKGDWQVPPKEVWEALEQEATWTNDTYTFDMGHTSGFFVNNKGKTIFLPEAGCIDGKKNAQFYLKGYYWTGSFARSEYCYSLQFDRSVHELLPVHYHQGFSIRPVRLEKVE